MGKESDCKHENMDYDHTHDIPFCCDCQKSFPPVESKRTEGKWFVVSGDIVDEQGNYVVARSNGLPYMSKHAKNLNEIHINSHRIVKAVNNHDGLVEALRKCLFDLKYRHESDSVDKANMKESVALGEKALKEVEGK